LIQGCRDGDASEIARIALGGMDPAAVKGLAEQKRAEAIARLGCIGLSAYRIERLTGIGRTLVRRILSQH